MGCRCVTALGAILKIYISQGSVATRLRCDGSFNGSFIANFLQIVAVKEFLKSVNIWRRYELEYGVSLFLTHSVYVFQLLLFFSVCHVVCDLFPEMYCFYFWPQNSSPDLLAALGEETKRRARGQQMMAWEERRGKWEGKQTERGQHMNRRCANSLKQPYINRREAKLSALRVITKNNTEKCTCNWAWEILTVGLKLSLYSITFQMQNIALDLTDANKNFFFRDHQNYINTTQHRVFSNFAF